MELIPIARVRDFLCRKHSLRASKFQHFAEVLLILTTTDHDKYILKLGALDTMLPLEERMTIVVLAKRLNLHMGNRSELLQFLQSRGHRS